jgi:hypothetical protein
MRRLFVVCSIAAVLLPQCNNAFAPHDTEVRVHNVLLSIVLPSRDTVEYVDLYGVYVGDVSFGSVMHGVTSSYRVTNDYGSGVALTVDSLRIGVKNCGTWACDTLNIPVSSVPSMAVAINRNEENTVTVDTTLIHISMLFGATRVRVENNLLGVRVHDGMNTYTIDSLQLFGVHIGNVTYSHIPAGSTTGFDSLTQYGTINLTIDSAVGRTLVAGGADTLTFVWDSIATLQRQAPRWVSTTVILDPSSLDLLNGLGASRLR